MEMSGVSDVSSGWSAGDSVASCGDEETGESESEARIDGLKMLERRETHRCCVRCPLFARWPPGHASRRLGAEPARIFAAFAFCRWDRMVPWAERRCDDHGRRAPE